MGWALCLQCNGEDAVMIVFILLFPVPESLC